MVNISEMQSLVSEDAVENMGLLLVDFQERLAPAIAESDAVIERTSGLLAAARKLGLPILATEQYPKGLGPTVARLRDQLAPEDIVEKTAFGAPRESAFREALTERELGHLLVMGMEAHVCVQQTVLCLLKQGYRVSLVSDAVASRVSLNREIAIKRMAAAGTRLTTAEETLARLEAFGASEGQARTN